MRELSKRGELETVLLYSARACILLVLIMPLIVRTELFFPFVVGKALYFRVLTEIASGIWLVLAFRYPEYRPALKWLLILFAAYLGIALLAGIFGVSLQRSLWSTYERMQGIVDLTHWFLFVLVASSVFRSSFDWRLLLNVNLGISLVMALMGVVQNYELFKIPGYGFLEATNRVDITLGNPTYVGAYMLVNVLIALGLLSHSYTAMRVRTVPRSVGRRRRKRAERQPPRDYALMWLQAFWATGLVIDLWAFVLSGTRGAVIGLAVSLGAFAFGYGIWSPWKGGRVAALSAVGLLFGAGTLFLVAKDTVLFDKMSESIYIVSRMRNISLDDASVKDRVVSWSAGLRGYAERPILGWGPENYVAAWGRHLEPESGATQIYDQAHNKPIEELTTKGTLGFSSYVVLWTYMMWVIYRRVRNRNDPEQILVLFIGAALVGYFVQNLFLFDTPGTVLQFMILLAYVVSLERTLEIADPEPGPSRTRGDDAAPRWQTGPALYALVLAVTVVVVMSIFFLNYSPYKGAQAVVQSSNPALSWEQQVALNLDAFDEFPPLANDPRLRMFSRVFSSWANLSEGDKVEALEMVDRESAAAIDKEPRAWRMYAVLASIYQRAADLDTSNLDRSKGYLARAFDLAPEPIAMSGIIQRQLYVEQFYGVVRATTTE